MQYTNGHSAAANGQNGQGSYPVSAATRLRGMLKNSTNIIVAPGVYDGFSARVALEVGFDCLYMVSNGKFSYLF